MNLTIYFKNDSGPKEGLRYNFSDEEYTRLRDDYEAYLKTDQPKGGTYRCRSAADKDPSHEAVLMIDFDNIALIDVVVHMEKIDETLRQQSLISRAKEQK